MKTEFSWGAAPKWRCPSCNRWVREEMSMRCVECRGKLLRDGIEQVKEVYD
jgi:hypothetical protein